MGRCCYQFYRITCGRSGALAMGRDSTSALLAVGMASGRLVISAAHRPDPPFLSRAFAAPSLIPLQQGTRLSNWAADSRLVIGGAGDRDAGVYHGKQAKTGNSLGLRFERALFYSHPEFNGEVEAHIIGPGRMLVVAHPEPKRKGAEEDPVLSSFMSFLATDMQRSPEHIKPLDAGVMERIGTLVSNVNTSPEEDLGDEVLI